MNIMSLKVYYDLLSQPCRAIIILLRANKIPFEPKEIKLAKGMCVHFKKIILIHPFAMIRGFVF